jgi:hypothetical protein
VFGFSRKHCLFSRLFYSNSIDASGLSPADAVGENWQPALGNKEPEQAANMQSEAYIVYSPPIRTISANRRRENTNGAGLPEWAQIESSQHLRLALAKSQNRIGLVYTARSLDAVAADCRSPRIPSPSGAVVADVE